MILRVVEFRLTRFRQHNHENNRLSAGKLAIWLAINAAMTLGTLLILPILIPYIAATKRHRRTFLRRLGWRFNRQHKRCIEAKQYRLWVHALSVGEVLSAKTLVDRLSDSHPHIQIIFTASTLTGFQIAERIFAERDIELAYFPYDWIVSIRTAAATINPHAVVIIETDIWPNFLIEMYRRRTPVYLVNMRMSDSAFRAYRRIKWAASRLFGAFDTICAQTEQDAMRLCRIGVDPKRITVTGNIKFDDVDRDNSDHTVGNWHLLIQAVQERQVIVAGSTHDGEEEALFDALRHIDDYMEVPLLIVAPRDPNRSAHVQELCKKEGRRCCRLSDLIDGKQNQLQHVIIADYIGVLKPLYGLADIAFVGGSLVSEGGHNPLEPAAWGIPVLFGPDMRDFHEIANWLLEAGGARQVAARNSLGPLLLELLNDPALAKTIGGRARSVFTSNKGAVAKTLRCLNLVSSRDIAEPHI